MRILNLSKRCYILITSIKLRIEIIKFLCKRDEIGNNNLSVMFGSLQFILDPHLD